jgi:hypothetical protein
MATYFSVRIAGRIIRYIQDFMCKWDESREAEENLRPQLWSRAGLQTSSLAVLKCLHSATGQVRIPTKSSKAGLLEEICQNIGAL